MKIVNKKGQWQTRTFQNSWGSRYFYRYYTPEKHAQEQRWYREKCWISDFDENEIINISKIEFLGTFTKEGNQIWDLE